MTDNHSQSFFGQATGIIINSPSKTDPFIFLRCIKKKPDGIWEKPSLGEGKTIRCSLEEIVMILQVLEGKTPSWSGYHKYKEKNTQISVNWEGNGQDKLWIRVGDYAKMFGFSQIEILRLLLNHILDEKIKFATGSNKSSTNNSNNNNNNNNRIAKIEPEEHVIREEIVAPYNTLDTLEHQLHSITDDDSFILNSLFENLLNYQIYVRQDLIDSDGGFKFKSFGELKDMKDGGLPAIQYVKGQGKGTNYMDSNIIYKKITKELFTTLYFESDIDTAFECEKGTILLLPDGNLIALKDDDNSVYVIEGLPFFLTTSETRPNSGNDEVISSTTANILSSWTSFKDLYTWSKPEKQRFEINQEVKENIKSIKSLVEILSQEGIELSEADILFGVDLELLSDYSVGEELIENADLIEEIIDLINSYSETIYIPPHIIKVINKIEVEEISSQFSEMIKRFEKDNRDIYSELTNENDRVRKVNLLAQSMDIDINQKPQFIVNEIIRKIGPFIFQMLLADSIIIKSDGTFIIKTLSKQKAVQFLGYGHTVDAKLDLIINIICSSQLRVGRYNLKIENQMSLQKTNLRNVYENFKKGKQGELILTGLRDELTDKFLYEFFTAIEVSINDMYETDIKHRVDLSLEEKREILKSYIKEFLQIGTLGQNKIFQKLKTDLTKFQSGKEKILSYQFTGMKGRDEGLIHTLEIILDKSLNNFIPTRWSLFSTGIQDPYLNRFARKSYAEFKTRLESRLKAMVGGVGKIDFMVMKWSGTKIHYEKYFNSGPFVIDFTSEGDDTINEMNFKRLYAAILMNKLVEFSMHSSTDVIASVSRFGCVLPSNQYEIDLDRTIKEFFTSTKMPRYIGVRYDAYSIPGMEKYAFFDFYLRFGAVKYYQQSFAIENKYEYLKKHLNVKEMEKGAEKYDDDDLRNFLDFYKDIDSSHSEVVELFEQTFLEPYTLEYTEYGTVNFKLKEHIYTFKPSPRVGIATSQIRFKDEYLKYHDLGEN